MAQPQRSESPASSLPVLNRSIGDRENHQATPRTAMKSRPALHVRRACRAVLECFAKSPTVYFCNALTPAGEWMRSVSAATTTQRATGPSALPG